MGCPQGVDCEDRPRGLEAAVCRQALRQARASPRRRHFFTAKSGASVALRTTSGLWSRSSPFELDQVEGVGEDAGVVAAVADAVEARHAILAAAHRLAVDDAGARAQAGERLHDQRETVGQVVAGRLQSRTRSPSLRAMSRKPSCLISSPQRPLWAGAGACSRRRRVKKRPTAGGLSPMPRPARGSRPGVHNRSAVVVIGVLLPTVAAAVAMWLLQQHRGGGTYGK